MLDSECFGSYRYLNKNLFIFKKRGRKIAFIKSTSSFCELSELAYQVLRAMKRDGWSIKNIMNHVPQQEIRECLNEIKILAGLFNDMGRCYKKKTFNHEFIRKYHPSSLVLNVSQTCNLSCRYCYGNNGTYSSDIPFMSLETAKAAIDFLIRGSVDRKTYEIIFFGGEPLLNFQLIKGVVGLCKQIELRKGGKFKFSITTNATVIDDEMIDFFKANQFGIMVSFDGDKNFHDKNRPFKGGHGSFDVVSRNIKLLASHFPIIGRVTLVRDMVNGRILNKIIENGRLLGINSIHLSPVDCTKVGPETIALANYHMNKLLDFFDKSTENNLRKLSLGDNNKIIFDPYAYIIRSFAEKRVKRRYRCGAFFGMRTVSTDGKIYPCHRFVGLRPFIIGNIWNGIDYYKVMKILENFDEIRHSICRKCWLNNLCGGPCYYNVANLDGTFNTPTTSFCRIQKRYYKTAMFFLCQYYHEIFEKSYGYIQATRYL